MDAGQLGHSCVIEQAAVVRAQHRDGVCEAEPVDQMLVVHVLCPLRRVLRSDAPVGEHPQAAVPGLKRVRRHRGQHWQLGRRTDRRVRGRQRVERYEQQPTPFEVIVKIGHAIEIVPQLAWGAVAPVRNPLVPGQSLREIRASPRYQILVVTERPTHMIAGGQIGR
jgi:hypothetical protein